MRIRELPGLSVDVPALLRGLGAEDLVLTVKSVVMTASCPKAVQPIPVCLSSRGITVDVPELLRGLSRSDLLAVVKQACEPWPAVKARLVKELLHIASGSAPGSPQDSAACGEESGVRLPPLGSRRTASPGRPPRPPGTMSRGSLACSLPNFGTASSKPSSADRDSAQLGDRLVRAVKAKDLPTVQALVVARANLDHTANDGIRPATLAMKQGNPPAILRTLLESRADVNCRDVQGRSLVHLWGWCLPKSRPGMKEAQKKLSILIAANADLDAQLPESGDSTLHVLAKVFNTLSIRAAGGSLPNCEDLALSDCNEAQKFAKATQIRLELLVTSGANTSACNTAGKSPLDLVEPQFWQQLPFFEICAEGAKSKLKASR